MCGGLEEERRGAELGTAASEALGAYSDVFRDEQSQMLEELVSEYFSPEDPDFSAVKLALGVDPSLNFAITNTTVNEAYYNEGQAMQNSAALLPDLIKAGVRVLAYAGNTGICSLIWLETRLPILSNILSDAVCNHMVSAHILI